MKNKLIVMVAAAVTMALLLAACGIAIKDMQSIKKGTSEDIEEMSAENEGNISVGFSQLGSESNWRMASSQSMKTSLTDKEGFSLIFEDGQQKQENQITAIRKFILQEVDYIVLDPVIESGWDSVLQEAKDAGIPVIIMDRRVNVSDSSLYSAWVGSNFLLEGRKACAWLKEFANQNNIDSSDIKIVDIQGTADATAQIGRTQGLVEAVKENGWRLLASEDGDFTQAKGQEVMKAMLQKYPELNVVYCENDDEAIGAINALQDAGRKIGTDIEHGEVMIMAFDATNAGLSNTYKGLIALDTECNPLYGPRVGAIIRELEAGRAVEKNSYVDEKMFSIDNSVPSVFIDGEEFPVTQLTKKIMEQREY